MASLNRHRLVWLSAQAWAEQAAAQRCDAEALACLQHWAAHGLPLVVTRQPQPRDTGTIDLGLAAPARWGRRRLFLSAPRAQVERVGDFPQARDMEPQLPAAARGAWTTLCADLAASGLSPRVFGSHGWQWLTGLDHVHARSDIDLLIACPSQEQADQASAILQRAPPTLPRLDGELVFDGGAAVAWREWAAWRAGRTATVLVKRLHAAALEDPHTWTVMA